MFKISILNKLISILGVSTISADRTYDWWTPLKQGAFKALVTIFDLLVNAAYYVLKFILNIVDLLQYFVKRLVGLDFWGTELVNDPNVSYLDHDIVFRFIKNDTVQRVFTYMLGIFVVLLIVFTIIAIIKSEYSYATGSAKDNSKKGIVGKSLRAILMVILVPILLIVGIMASNAVLQGIVNAFNLNRDITFGGQVFVASSYGANKYRNYGNGEYRLPTSTSIVLYYSTDGSGNIISNTISTEYSRDKKSIEFNTSVPDVNPMNYGKKKKVTGFSFKRPSSNAANNSSTKNNPTYFWKAYHEGQYGEQEQTVQYEILKYYLKDIMHYTDVKEYKDVSLHDLDGSHELIGYIYNSWLFNEYMTQVMSFEDSVVSTRVGFTSSYGTRYDSALTYKNNQVWAERYDGGEEGFVALRSEYKVMGDFMDFMVENNLSCSIVDITNNEIDWSKVPTEISRYYNTLDNKINQFMVEYVNEGYVVYTPRWNKESELEGSIYIMCYKDINTKKYVPVLANTVQEVQLATINGVAAGTDTYKFESDSLGSKYTGFIIARGGFTGENKSFADADYPTYISATTTLKNENGLIAEVKLTDAYKVDTTFTYAEFDFIKVIGGEGYLPNRIETNAFIEKIEDDTEIPNKANSYYYYYQWKDDRPLTLKDEINNINETVKVGVNGREKPFKDVFYYDPDTPANTADDISWEVTGYSYVNEYGNNVYGFTAEIDGSVRGFLLEHDAETNTLSFIRCDDFYYVYWNDEDGGYYYLFQDGTFQPDIDPYTNDKGEKVDVAIFNFYNMTLEGVEEDDTDVKTATYSVEGFVYNSSYVAKLAIYNPSDLGAADYIVDGKNYYNTNRFYDTALIFDKKCDGFIYKIDYYNFYTFKNLNGEIKTYNYKSSDNPNTIADERIENATPLKSKTGRVMFSDIRLERWESGSNYKFPKTITFSDPHIVFYLDSSLSAERLYSEGKISLENGDYEALLEKAAEWNETNFIPLYNNPDDSWKPSSDEAIKDFLINGWFYLYEDETFDTYSELEYYINDADAITDYNDYVVQISFVNKRPNDPIWTLDCELDLSAFSNDNVALRFHLAPIMKVATNKVVESFEDGTFFMDYNFTKAGPRLNTVYNMWLMDFLILAFAAVLLLKTLGTAVWGLISRIYEITIYFIIMPGIAAMLPLDSGDDKFNNWRKNLISKVLATYGVMIGLNVFFILVEPIKQASKLFNAEDMARMTSGIGRILSGSAELLNKIVFILFLLVAFTMINTAPKIISELVGAKDNDILKKGNDTRDAVNKNKEQVGKVISGQEALETGKNFIGDIPKFIPGSALVKEGAKIGAKGLKKGFKGLRDIWNGNVGESQESEKPRDPGVRNDPGEEVSDSEPSATPVFEAPTETDPNPVTTEPSTTKESESTSAEPTQEAPTGKESDKVQTSAEPTQEAPTSKESDKVQTSDVSNKETPNNDGRIQEEPLFGNTPPKSGAIQEEPLNLNANNDNVEKTNENNNSNVTNKKHSFGGNKKQQRLKELEKMKKANKAVKMSDVEVGNIIDASNIPGAIQEESLNLGGKPDAVEQQVNKSGKNNKKFTKSNKPKMSRKEKKALKKSIENANKKAANSAKKDIEVKKEPPVLVPNDIKEEPLNINTESVISEKKDNNKNSVEKPLKENGVKASSKGTDVKEGGKAEPIAADTNSEVTKNKKPVKAVAETKNRKQSDQGENEKVKPKISRKRPIKTPNVKAKADKNAETKKNKKPVKDSKGQVNAKKEAIAVKTKAEDKKSIGRKPREDKKVDIKQRKLDIKYMKKQDDINNLKQDLKTLWSKKQDNRSTGVDSRKLDAQIDKKFANLMGNIEKQEKIKARQEANRRRRERRMKESEDKKQT